jgi:hypothetical protein
MHTDQLILRQLHRGSDQREPTVNHQNPKHDSRKREPTSKSKAAPMGEDWLAWAPVSGDQ